MANTRKLALELLKEVEEGAFLNLVLKKGLKDLDERDRRFTAALIFTLLENRIKIDYIIEKYTDGKRLHRIIRDILRLGVCQLVFMDGVPESAAVNECVKLCASSPKRQLKGFVNAVLRNIARDCENIEYPKKEDGAAKYFSVMFSYPEWICEKYIADYGEEFCEELLSYRRSGSMTCVRANLLKVESTEKLERKLIGAAFKTERGRLAKEAIYIKNMTSVEELGMYKRGELTVQGEASMLVVKCADIKEGMSVADVCAAPGGKTAFAAQLKPSRLLAMELHEHRAELMKKNFERMGVNAQIAVGDASVPRPELFEKFDRVLVDAPCSALGLLYRKPDIKLKKQPDELKELAKIETEILETASRYVKKGGRLVYSTCTIDKLENDCVVDDFLSRHGEFEYGDIKKTLPEGLKDFAEQGRIQLFPHRDGIDGFFISVLERRK